MKKKKTENFVDLLYKILSDGIIHENANLYG